MNRIKQTAISPADISLSDIQKAARELLSRRGIERDYGIREQTQAVWHSTNRYGWRDLAIKVGANVRYRRGDIERWLESRRVDAGTV